MVKIAILGFGTVGSGVYEVLHTNFDNIAKKAGDSVEIKYILDKRDFPGHPVESLLVKDFQVILEDQEVEIIVEVMGGVEPAYTFAKASISAGKSFITSNKELVAKYGAELLELAKLNHVNFMFEASVGGGIPIIRPLNQSLTADEIYKISGILNGTTNYMLTRMSNEGLSFDVVLKDAQALGFAEANPSADVDGHDACRKIAILSSLAYGMHVDYSEISTEGIREITPELIFYSKQLDAEIKLLANSEKIGNKIFAYVAPTIIPRTHVLSNVNGVFNAIFVKGNVIGDVMFYGSGAGKLPTASAVVADIIDTVKHRNTNVMSFWSTEKLTLDAIDHYESKRLLRVKYYAGIEKQIDELFGNVKYLNPAHKDEVAFITNLMTENSFTIQLDQLRSKASILNNIRVQD